MEPLSHTPGETEESAKLRRQLEEAQEQIEKLSLELEREKQRTYTIQFLAKPLADEKTEESSCDMEIICSDRDDLSQDGESESSSSSGSSSNEAEDLQSPLSPCDDDIRLRATRTLLMADCALKRSVQQERKATVPETVQIPAKPNRVRTEESGSVLSSESARKTSPLESLQQFVHGTVDDVKGSIQEAKGMVSEFRKSHTKAPPIQGKRRNSTLSAKPNGIAVNQKPALATTPPKKFTGIQQSAPKSASILPSFDGSRIRGSVSFIREFVKETVVDVQESVADVKESVLEFRGTQPK